MMRPYRVKIAQEALDDLAARLAATRFTRPLPGHGLGVPADRVRHLVEYWRDGYDWRAWERRINVHPQFLTEIDGLDVHFLHIRSARPDALPLILTHGWPMSVVEFLPLIERLSDAFHLVIPSVPGFGFSGVPREPGWNRRRVAVAWAELMRRLGYERYGAHGNDVGSMISIELGRLDPHHVVGVHVTQIFSLPSADPAEHALLGPSDRAKLAALERFVAGRSAYLALQSTQPQTLAHALADSPAGQLAWNLQLFGDAVSDDYILTDVGQVAGIRSRFGHAFGVRQGEVAGQTAVRPSVRHGRGTACRDEAGAFGARRAYCLGVNRRSNAKAGESVRRSGEQPAEQKPSGITQLLQQ
ncbi:alpha/beta fold hydrolase [Nonomuraea sp. NN258]|uniref:epoxide hydrolase family protein n=1 Tax=Nonomuraea antri TaxID=2730852 RepID=UPI0015695ECA|nr:epoxide hydrolase [Nonomuraea antri]NRQ32139.1 alpha/beta fold hydrolase [Nonomuraea antri]